MIKKGGCRHVLDLMPEKERNGLIALGSTVEYREESCLFQKGDPGDSFYIITAGSVFISVSSAEGKEIILNRLTAGEVFGEIAMFDQSARTADAIVAAGTKLISIDRARFFEFLDKTPSLYGAVIQHLCGRIRYCSAQVESFVLEDSLERLVSKLVYLAESAGQEKRALIEVSQSNLAKMLGLSREAVNKNLRELQAAGLIALGQKKIMIPSVAALEHFLTGRED